MAAKRGNPDYTSSSFYVKKAINNNFDRAILELRAKGESVDRSDILELLMQQWANHVLLTAAK